MENAIRFRQIRRDKALEREIEGVLDEIKEVCHGIESAFFRFRNETDSDLIDAWIFEQAFFEARYRYLLRTAKRLGIIAIPRLKSINCFGNES